jgi:hypothetical protein
LFLFSDFLKKLVRKIWLVIMEAHRIYIVSQAGIGDLVMFTPTLHTIKDKSSDTKITFSLTKNNPFVDLVLGGLVDDVNYWNRVNWFSDVWHHAASSWKANADLFAEFFWRNKIGCLGISFSRESCAPAG